MFALPRRVYTAKHVQTRSRVSACTFGTWQPRDDRTGRPTTPATTRPSQLRRSQEEIAHLRARLADAPKRVRSLEERLLETKGQLASASARTRSCRTRCARPASTSPRCATRSTSCRSRRRPTASSSARTTTARSTSSPADARCASRCIPTSTHELLDRGAEVVLNESFNVVMARHRRSPARSSRSRRSWTTASASSWSGAPTRSGCASWPMRSAARTSARRPSAARHAFEPAAREAAPARGRGPPARRGARHLLHRHRRPRRPDRADRRCRRAAVPAPGPVRRAPAAGAEGHPALRPARLRQDADRQGGRQQPGQEGRRDDRRGQGAQLLHQHQGPGAAQQVRR